MATVTVTDLLLLIAVLFIVYFIINTMINKKKRETFEQTSKPKTNKACSQTSINDGYLNYTFGGIKKFVR